MIGQVISHYQIIEELGGGGMGVVYKALDTKLDRFVALKFLPAQFGQAEEHRSRFFQEARTASALDHPNICTIYEIDETDEHQVFIAMAFYKGETLKKKLLRGPLNSGQASAYADQIAAGLERAHEIGIVHRDIKPANIMVTERDEVKILDFGLAKFAGQSRITQTGVAVGTLAYMAPEQLQGSDVDHRVDIWGLGVLLYTMVAGAEPFERELAPEQVTAILTMEPPNLLNLSRDSTQELSEVVDKAMQKDPNRRYQSVREMRAVLRAATGPRQAASLETVPGDEALRPSIAVLPFVNMSQDPENEYFSDGLAEELINALTRLDGLNVVSRTSAFRFRGEAFDIREIGKKLQVDSILEGSVRKVGNRLRVTAQLVNVSDGYHTWSERYDRELSDVFAVQDEITLAIVDKLKARLLAPDKAKLVRRQTDNPEAFDLFLQGRYQLNKRTASAFHRALECFLAAIESEPEYASAHAGVSESYALMERYGVLAPDDSMPEAKKAAEKALKIDPTLADAHTALAFSANHYYWDWKRAEKEYQLGIDLNPKQPGGHHFYAWFLAGQGRPDEAIEQMREAVRLDPYSLISHAGLGAMLYMARKFDEAETQLLKTLELEPAFAVALQWLGRTYHQQGRHDEATGAYEHALGILGNDPETLGIFGHALASAGEAASAGKLLGELKELSAERYVSSYWPGIVYLGLNDLDSAFEQLDKAADDRSDWMVYVGVDPIFDPVRSDPRFTGLLRRLNL